VLRKKGQSFFVGGESRGNKSLDKAVGGRNIHRSIVRGPLGGKKEWTLRFTSHYPGRLGAVTQGERVKGNLRFVGKKSSNQSGKMSEFIGGAILTRIHQVLTKITITRKPPDDKTGTRNQITPTSMVRLKMTFAFGGRGEETSWVRHGHELALLEIDHYR